MSYLILSAIAIVLGGWYIYKHSGLLKDVTINAVQHVEGDVEKLKESLTANGANYSGEFVNLTSKPAVENAAVTPVESTIAKL